jgi:agmatinase
MSSPEEFDADGPASIEDGLFGLGAEPGESRIHLIPVPFEATTSYGGGASEGPRAILEASLQVDLFDVDGGRVYEQGIVLLPEDEEIRRLNAGAKLAAQRVIAQGGRTSGRPELESALDLVNEAGAEVNEIVRAAAAASLDAGHLVGVVGGDHASPYGLIAALAERHDDFGILHLDAHHDLRRAYEGFTWSHASIMYNVAERLPQVSRIAQVAVRDFGEQEADYARASGGRIVTAYDAEIRQSLFAGHHFDGVARAVVDQLPELVYVSFDIDGLDPKLCPHTGTPVPGGLDFEEAVHFLRVLRASGRRIIGFDLCEVAPGADEWDANVGARVLYKLCAFARP